MDRALPRQPGRPLLDPALLASIADLEFVARVTVDGTVTGLHRSPFHGYSAEFSQYRHYRPGDDLKYVDWKLLARTDRIYTRQYRETTNMISQVAVDTSGSMGACHCAEGSLLRETMWRTSSSRISAAVPGSVSRPFSLSMERYSVGAMPVSSMP